MNNKYFILGIVLVVAASFLLVMQVDFTSQKNNEEINMYIFKNGLVIDVEYPYNAKEVVDPTDTVEEDKIVLNLYNPPYGIEIESEYPYKKRKNLV